MINTKKQIISMLTTTIALLVVSGCSSLSGSYELKYRQVINLPPYDLKCIDPPTPIKQFISDYFSALHTNDIKEVSKLFSEDYLDDGYTKQDFMHLLYFVVEDIDECDERNYCILKLESVSENSDQYIAEILWNLHGPNNWMSSQGDMIKLEDGIWKFYGNQRPKK